MIAKHRMPRSLLIALLFAPAYPAGAGDFTRGDCNADGSIAAGKPCELSDAVFALNFLFIGGPTPACLEACDSNDDGELNLSDAVYQLSFCFLGGTPPAAPFPDCGSDPSPSLGCGGFPPCAGECAPQDARGVGPCDAIVGVFWDGFRCLWHSGCSCEGEDCDDKYGSLEDCYAAHAGCDSVCEPMDVRGTEPCRRLPRYFWDGSACQAYNYCDCEGQDCDRLFDTAEACEAAVAGCPRVAPCDPMDVQGVGACKLLLGFYWDGKQCQSLGGCSCEGEDCAELFPDMKSCEDAHAGCAPGG